MTAEEVTVRVNSELADHSPLNSWHGITRNNAGAFRVRPIEKEFSDPSTDSTHRLWVVMDERAESQTDGYLVVFDEVTGYFGLAVKGGSACDGTFIGFYGNLVETLNSM